MRKAVTEFGCRKAATDLVAAFLRMYVSADEQIKNIIFRLTRQ
jgi:hypothetical protein